MDTPRVWSVTENEILSRTVTAASRRAAAAIGADDPALVERVRGVELVPVILGQPLDAVVAALLVALEDEHDVALERNAGARQAHGGGSEHRDPAFVIERAAPVEIAVLDHARERIDTPQLRLYADGVRVRREQDRLALGIGAPKARDQVRLARDRRLNDGDLEAQWRESGGHEGRDLAFIAGRVGRIQPHKITRERDDLGVRLGRRDPAARVDDKRCQRADQDGDASPVMKHVRDLPLSWTSSVAYPHAAAPRRARFEADRIHATSAPPCSSPRPPRPAARAAPGRADAHAHRRRVARPGDGPGDRPRDGGVRGRARPPCGRRRACCA